MPETKRYTASLESQPLRHPAEIQSRIACEGKSAAVVLEQIRRDLHTADCYNADPLIVLENLGHLQDSVTTLIKGVSRLLVGYGRKVTFWESSGYTEAFLSVMEGRAAR